MFRVVCCFFFKQNTAYEMRISDWSSDVCSSDLSKHRRGRAADQNAGRPEPGVWDERNRREPVPATPARIDEDGFEILGSLQSRLGVERRVPTAVGETGRA